MTASVSSIGYWRSSNMSTSVHACLKQSHCEPSGCATHREGPLCAVCEVISLTLLFVCIIQVAVRIREIRHLTSAHQPKYNLSSCGKSIICILKCCCVCISLDMLLRPLEKSVKSAMNPLRLPLQSALPSYGSPRKCGPSLIMLGQTCV
jgi:hypothetical protein